MKKSSAYLLMFIMAIVFFGVGRWTGQKGFLGTPPKVEKNVKKAEKEQRNKPAKRGSTKEEIYKVPIGKAAIKGNPNAKVTIVEISDFQCPFCKRGNDTVSQVLKTYGNDVRVAFKHNPLPFHKAATPAAQAVIAAQNQGKFWELHDKLFENSRQLTDELIEKLASDLGLNMEKLKADMKSDATKRIIDADQALARQLGARGTPAFFINGVKLSGAQPFNKFKEVIDVQLKKANEYLGKGVSPKRLYAELTKNGLTKAVAKKKPNRGAPDPNTVYKVELSKNSHIKGNKNAKVTIVEWSEFQCPFCSRVLPTLDKIKETYKDEVRFIFKHNPLPFHKDAMLASEATLAAGEQGKFWEMHDKLFANQKALKRPELEKYAKELGLNMSKFKKALDTHKFQEEIKSNQSQGMKLGARGTPAFFINGIFISGAQPFPNFKSIIDKQMKKADALLKKGIKREQLYNEIIKNGKTKAVAPKRPKAPEIKPQYVDAGNSPFKGPKHAKVTIIEFSDFQCPYCKRGADTATKIAADYKNDVKVVFKHNPLSFHKDALPAAEASMAAGDQGKFWEMHDILFNNAKQLKRPDLEKYAQQLGLNMDKFKEALDSGKFKQQIKADQALAGKIGARGAPTFFINGKVLRGAQPFDRFKEKIDAELKKADKLLKKGVKKQDLYKQLVNM